MELTDKIIEFLNTEEIRDSIQKTNKLDYVYDQFNTLDREHLTRYFQDLGIEPADQVTDKIYNSMYAGVARNDGEFILNPAIVLIEMYGFVGCKGTSFKTLPGSKLTSIAMQAFAYSDFKELSFAEGLCKINPRAFAEMIYLETISLPKSLKYIGDSIFVNCYKLDKINYAGTVEEFSLLLGNSVSDPFVGIECESVICSDGKFVL